MSTGKRSSGGAGVQPIPAGSRKVVQSLKEIVKCSEAEIYAALRDCDMDPNEAVNRLLFQDPFHEVKSKREKKKEGKDTESRPHGSYTNSNRGGKNDVDRYLGRTSSTPYSSSEHDPSNGKLVFQKENGSTMQTSSFCSVPLVSIYNKSLCPPSLRDVVVGENKRSSLDSSDGATSGRQPPCGYQSAWIHSLGQVSVADIVKMGGSHDKASSATSSSHLDMNHHDFQGPTTSAIQHNLIFSENHPSNVYEVGFSSSHNITSNREWPSIQKPADIKKHFPIDLMDAEMHLETSDIVLKSINHQFESEEMQGTEDTIENPRVNDMVSVLESSQIILGDDSRSASLSDNDLHEHMTSYQPHGYDFKHHEDEEVDASIASISRNLLQLNMKKDARGLPSDEDVLTLIIPDHLLVQTADCSHLRFGSFRSDISAAYTSGAITSLTEKPNLAETRSEADISSVGYLDSRITDYFAGDAVRTASNVNVFHGTGANIGSYEALSVSQAIKMKPKNAEVAHGNHHSANVEVAHGNYQLENVELAYGNHRLENVEVAYENHHSFPALNSDYSFDDVQRLNAAFTQSQTSSQLQNPSPFTNMMSYTNSLPSTMLAPNLQYPPFPVAQTVSAKYGSSITCINSSAICVSEALKVAGFSSMQSSPLAPSGTNVVTGPPLPQHLALHPQYSQPTLPLGPYTNIIGYPFLPQNYTFMPSAFQQTLTGNGAYQQSLAGILPQYKNSISVGSLGQSSNIAPGYAPFGNTTTTPANFLMNPPAALPGASLSYDDSSISLYKESSHPISLQQNGNSGLWLDRPNSRMLSAVQSTALRNYHGQDPQPGGYNQGQQPSQDYGFPGYRNVYNSHLGGSSLDQLLQNSRVKSPGGSQGQPKLPQIWQNGY